MGEVSIVLITRHDIHRHRPPQTVASQTSKTRTPPKPSTSSVLTRLASIW